MKIIGLVFVLSGMMTGMAGFWFAAYNTFININIANHFVLPAVAAVLSGGSPFSGGKGIYVRTMIGVIVGSLRSASKYEKNITTRTGAHAHPGYRRPSG
jgi:ribose transport system permease protein